MTKDVSSSPRSVWELTSAERESAKKCKRFFKRKGKQPALSSKEVKRNVVDSLDFSSYNGMSYTGMSHTGMFRDLSDENHLLFFAPCFDKVLNFDIGPNFRNYCSYEIVNYFS